MTKRFLIATTILIVVLQSQAQLKGFSIGPYVEVAWPNTNLDISNKNGIGVGLNADIRLGKLGLTGSAGYMHFAGKTVETNEGPVDKPAVDAIPVRAGIKYRFIPLLYAKLEGGVATYTNSNGSALILSPGLGLRLLGLDVEAKYEVWAANDSRGFWGLKVGYNF